MRRIRIVVTAWDSGCLLPLIDGKLAEINRRERALGDTLSAEEREMMATLRAQLDACRVAVERARRP